MTNKDLVALLRVSQHFFSLASAEIYRELDFNFVSSDVDSGTPTSRTADALQTIVTSKFVYGGLIRSFRLGVLEESDHNALLMSRVLWDSVADPSKVLNTLILLMLRGTSLLESFLYVLCADISTVWSTRFEANLGTGGIRLSSSADLYIRPFTNCKIYAICESGSMFPHR